MCQLGLLGSQTFGRRICWLWNCQTSVRNVVELIVPVSMRAITHQGLGWLLTRILVRTVLTSSHTERWTDTSRRDWCLPYKHKSGNLLRRYSFWGSAGSLLGWRLSRSHVILRPGFVFGGGLASDLSQKHFFFILHNVKNNGDKSWKILQVKRSMEILILTG